MDPSNHPAPDLTSITADIVSSYVANNAVHRADLPAVIAAVHAALQGLVAPRRTEPEKPAPAVSIRRSVTPDFLISLEDGKKYKTLKRHLGKLGLTADEYRAKWGLPADYPMVAPSYAAKRSELAKSSGLGQQRRKSAAKAVVAPDETVKAPTRPLSPSAVLQQRRRRASKLFWDWVRSAEPLLSSRSFLFDSNCFKGAPDSDTGRLYVSSGQQFVDNSECHDRIRPLDSV